MEENSLYVDKQRIWQNCPYCRSQKQPLFMHGGYHCVDCKVSVGPSCSGEWDIRDLSGDKSSTG